ncbi:MAG: uroporphyrinogen decarboxylase family protein [Syntrophales bacterium]|nr:uroporphyrinogen decarboxylase family protein [Syntrophales bacterium]
MNKLAQYIKELGRTPIIPLAGSVGLQLTRTSMKTSLTDSGRQKEALLALCREVELDAIFTIMDLTVEAEYLGCRLKFPEDEPPAVVEPALSDEEKIDDLFEGKAVGGRMPLFAEVVQGLKASLDMPVCAYVIGPFTLAGQVMDLALAMKATRKKPEMLHHLLSRCSDLIIHYARLLTNAGADLVCILEPSAMMISASKFQEFSSHYCKKIISNNASAMSVLHICGDTNHLISEMETTGAEGLSLDSHVDIQAAYDRLAGETVLIGNVNPVDEITFGTPESVREKSEQLIRAMEGKNFILSTGCDVPQNAPLENIKAMISVKRKN